MMTTLHETDLTRLGLVTSDGTKPLPEPMLTYQQSSPVGSFIRYTRSINHDNYSFQSSWKYPRANELMHALVRGIHGSLPRGLKGLFH